MQSKTLLWRLFACLAIVTILAGCGQAATPTIPTATAMPTVDTQPTLQAVQTQAVATAIMGITQNAPTVTPVTPTETQVPPTATLAVTDTPVPPTATPTHVFIPWTKTPTAAPQEYACSILSTSPSPTDKITVNQDFDGKWSVKNIGTKTWSSGDVDVRYSTGEKFQTGGDIIDLPHDVAPNGTVDIVIDMKAPSNDGTHTTGWVIGLPNNVNCSLNLTLNVSK